MKKRRKKSKAACPAVREVERVPSGIDGLDKLIEGGFVKDSTIMVRGGTGTGKTLFCLQYLYNGVAKYDEAGVYLSFSESESIVCQHAARFGWDLKKLNNRDKFVVARYEPHEVANIMAQGGGTIRDIVEELDAKRLVVDSLTAYEMVFESKYKANESILAFFDLLRKWDTTTLVTSEHPVTPYNESDGRLGFLTDGLLNLYHMRNNSCRTRALEVVKMRDTFHDENINNFMITKKGLKIGRRLSHVGRKR
jgi:circadian clock protein KaiC